MVRIHAPQPEVSLGVRRLLREQEAASSTLALPTSKRETREADRKASLILRRPLALAGRDVWRRRLPHKEDQQGSIPWPGTNDGRNLSRAVPGTRLMSGRLGGSTPLRPTDVHNALVELFGLIRRTAGFDSQVDNQRRTSELVNTPRRHRGLAGFDPQVLYQSRA